MKDKKLNLKPCPFCGYEVDESDVVHTRSYWVICPECEAEGPTMEDAKSAVKIWDEAKR
jgi:Lar family restriction alleviation protein